MDMKETLKIRETTEKLEEQNLHPNATYSSRSKGRIKTEKLCPIRTVFQRDRDRIIHSKSFRRLKHKTQVFLAPLGDHYRTRLTHTLEVAQIARTIAKALRLNEDLTEAIALGHDLGHTPFGHSGEEVLDNIPKLVSPIIQTNFLYNLNVSNLESNKLSSSVLQILSFPINLDNNFKKVLLPLQPAPIKQNKVWIG